MTTKHSATPWKAIREEHNKNNWAIFADDLIAHLQSFPNNSEQTESNARHIVHCVNQHSKLVETLKECKAIFEREGMDRQSLSFINDALSAESEGE